MRRLWLLSLLLAAPLARATTYPMTLHKVMDPQGIKGVAYQYLAPKGWTVKAQLSWTPQILQPTVLVASADSPDGRFGYSILPGMDFSFSGVTDSQQFYGHQQGFKNGMQPPQRLSDLIVQLTQSDKTISDVRVTKRTDQPLSAQQLGSMRNFGMVSTVEYTFTKNGHSLTAVTAARMDGNLAGSMQGGGQAFNGDWEIVNAFTVYGPAGEEKKAMRFFSLAAPTYTPTKAFVLARGTYILALNHQIQEQIQSIGEISRITARLSDERRNAIMGNYRSHQAAQDRAQSQFCDYIGDIDRYHTADGTEMQLASGYKDAWTNRAGDVVLSDNVGYDPNQGSGGGWTRMQKAH